MTINENSTFDFSSDKKVILDNSYRVVATTSTEEGTVTYYADRDNNLYMTKPTTVKHILRS